MQVSDSELSRARELCSATELRLIEASHGPALEKASASQLKKKIALARELRDKWRDLFTQQRREAQQQRAARAGLDNARSREKSELFANALIRLEGQLARAESAPSATPEAASTSAPEGPSKRVRAQEHRLARARTREQLEEQRSAMEKEKRAASQPTPEAPSAVETAPSRKTPEAASSEEAKAEPAKTPEAAPQGKKARAAKALKESVTKSKRMARANLTKNVLPFAEQPGAKAAAKRARIKVSGLNTRTRGHVSARGKRAQARRDSKA